MAFEDLVGKTVAITGGAGVIGHALAHGLAANGLNIAILDLDEGRAQKLANELVEKRGIKSLGIACNVLERPSIESARDTLVDYFDNQHQLRLD